MAKKIYPEIELTIDSIGFEGVSIARHDGKVHFIQGGIPGDRVLCSIHKNKSKYAEGTIKQVLIPGQGRIQPACSHFGVRYIKRANQPWAATAVPVAQLHATLAHHDTLVSTLPDTPASRGLLDAAALAALPRGAVFVNVGRGSVVDEIALADALGRGHDDEGGVVGRRGAGVRRRTGPSRACAGGARPRAAAGSDPGPGRARSG